MNYLTDLSPRDQKRGPDSTNSQSEYLVGHRQLPGLLLTSSSLNEPYLQAFAQADPSAWNTHSLVLLAQRSAAHPWVLSLECTSFGSLLAPSKPESGAAFLSSQHPVILPEQFSTNYNYLLEFSIRPKAE